MVFSEVYGTYFNVVASILKEAISGSLSDESLTKIVREKAFAESMLTIPSALKEEKWSLITKKMQTPLKQIPQMPLSTLQKRWMKALLLDPRIKLFSPSESGLEDISPLYTQDMIVFFDRYADGDPFDDEKYITHFKTILLALREKRRIRITFNDQHNKPHKWNCIPYRLEYSSKDDKFRLIATFPKQLLTVNLSRIKYCELLDFYLPNDLQIPELKTETLILELLDERNSLERAMLHFSHLEKITERLENNRYRITLKYRQEDETEILICLLSFGPMIQISAPQKFIELVKNRLEQQKNYE